MEKGWIGALRQISRDSLAWRGRWVLLQYTALGWSRRGFTFGALVALVILQRRGARCAVVFHEPCRQPSGARLHERFRGVYQDWVIRRLYGRAHKAIFTVPLETVSWLRKRETKGAFIPIGANIPQRVTRRITPFQSVQERKTVIVFAVTSAPKMLQEVKEISDVMREANKVIERLRLVAVGRGTDEAKEQFEKALEGSGVELVVRGVLPAEEVALEFESAHALLFVRGPITLRRGSALAGIASGIPIVGYSDGSIDGPLKGAGIEWVPGGDRPGLAHALIRVLTDPPRWRELHERNVLAQRDWFSWTRIGQRFYDLLGT
jgi:glycosyltransferase involved in cell wall biosynthesis